MEVSGRAVNESDLVLYVLDALRAPGPEEEAVARLLVPLSEKTIAAVNKMDGKGADYERARGFLTQQLPGLPGERCFKISAQTGEGIEPLLSCLFSLAPPGEAFYGEDYYTDQKVDFRIAEIIREQAINRLRQELPHALYVEVADTEITDNGARLWVRAFIMVERESQKGMVVGKGGEMIKAIRQSAQKELNRIFDWKTDLDLRVKTGKDWRHNDAALRRLIER
jgi:GTP-binding protein Era